MKPLLVSLTAITMAAASPAAAADTAGGQASTTVRSMVDKSVDEARVLMMSDPAGARAIGERLERGLSGMTMSREHVRALSRARWIAGEATLREGDTAKARRLVESSIRLADKAGDASARADALLTRGSLNHETGRSAVALKDYLSAAELFRVNGNARGNSIALQYLGMLYDAAADYDRAERYMKGASAAYPGDPRMRLSRANVMAQIYTKKGDTAAAMRSFEQAATTAKQAGEHVLEARVRMAQADALMEVDQTRKAGKALETALSTMRSHHVKPDENTTAVTARYLARTGRAAEAGAMIDKLEPARVEREGQDRTTVHNAAYEVYKRAGRYDDALIQLEISNRTRAAMTSLSLSNKAALMASRFDYEGQKLRIAQLREQEMRRRYDDERQASERRWTGTVSVAIALYVLITILTYGVITLRRSRDQVRVANEGLAKALDEVKEHAAAERRATVLAEHDTLTGLPNRRHMQERLDQHVGDKLTSGTPCVAMLLDLDRFKAVNDVHGHQTGDAVLIEVARRLAEIAGEDGIFPVRVGGDEFNLILTGDCSEEACERLAKRVLDEIGRAYDIGERRHQLGTSIGIARYPEDAKTVDRLMHAADVAMYEAKRDGRNTYRFYDAAIDQRIQDRAEMETDLKAAVRDHQIEAWFQPITCLGTGRVLGFEALARWNHQGRGMVPPDVFIPIAEEAGLIDEITTQILQQSCRAARDWPEDVTVSVNMSPVMLRDSWVIAKTFGILQQERLRPERLVIEITESAVIDDLDFAQEAVSAFRNAGIRVALDDFGCGYSSLSTLRQLDFDHIKLDGSFVRTLGSGDSLKITTAVAGLAKAMGMTATAEGVEDEKTGEILRDLGFDCGQGYLYGRPTPRAQAALVANGDMDQMDRKVA